MKNKIVKRGIIFSIVVLFFGVGFLPTTTSIDPVDLQTAIDDGLAWLVDQQDVGGGWNAYGGAWEAGTGLALYKLCERAYELGYESPFDPEYEYYLDVIDGFNWAFDHLFTNEISPQDHTTGATGTIDDPDTNGNGIGVCAQPGTYLETYSTGILLAGISASRTPSRVVNVPGSPVDGWTYEQVVQDMVDFLAFGQVEYPVPGITVEGGWEYFHMDNGAYGSGWMGDQSNSGYAVLGLAEAEAFGATIPEWVKIELDAWIDHVQDDITGDPNDGGSWYSYPGDSIGVNLLKTGNLLTQMALVGDTPSTPRVIDAIDYIEDHWYDASGANSPPGWDGTPAQYQAMFCLMKGLVFIGIDDFGGIDWFEDIATVILAQQDKTVGPTYGSWRESSGRGEPVIITEWALLTLEKIAPPPPFTVTKDFRYTSVDFTPYHWEDPDCIPDNGDEYWMQDPAILGDLLPMDIDGNYLVDVVLKKNGKVASTNPGQLYGVISITGPVLEVFIEDDFDKEFDINPAKYGGGIEVLIVDPMGYAEVITNYPGVTGSVWNDDPWNDAFITIDLDTAIGGPLPPDHTLMIYVKFQTAMKHQLFPDPSVPYDFEFWNRPMLWINEDDYITDPPTKTVEAIIELSIK